MRQSSAIYMMLCFCAYSSAKPLTQLIPSLDIDPVRHRVTAGGGVEQIGQVGHAQAFGLAASAAGAG